MGIFQEFEIIFDIKDANYIAKPDLTLSYDEKKLILMIIIFQKVFFSKIQLKIKACRN